MAPESPQQSDIDALLGGAADQGPGESTPAPGVAVLETGRGEHTYDFRRPRRISTDKLRSLEAMYERFAKSLEGWLLSRVRGNVQLTLQSVEELSFGEFVRTLPTPCASFTFEVRSTGGQEGIVDFGHEFAYYLVDRLFGGGTGAVVPDRALTPLERMAVRVAAERMLSLVTEIWSDYVEMQLELVGFESLPEILRIANREDPVLVARLAVAADEMQSSVLVCLPFAVLEKFFAGGQERRVTVLGSPEEQLKNRSTAEHTLRGTRLAVSARLPEFRVSLKEFFALKIGSLVSTGLPRGAELDVFVGRQARFRAHAGRIGASLAVRLTEDVQPAPEQIIIPFTRT